MTVLFVGCTNIFGSQPPLLLHVSTSLLAKVFNESVGGADA